MELLKHKNEDEEYTYYIKDGKKKIHGLYRDRYPNGQLAYEYNYKEGDLHGHYRAWHSNGQLSYEKDYKEHEPHGLSRHWDEDGQLEYEFYWHEGVQYESKEECDDSLLVNRSW